MVRRFFVYAAIWGAALCGSATGATAQDIRLGFFLEIEALVAANDLDKAEARLESAFLGAMAAPLPERLDLLDELAAVQQAAGKIADAGDTLWNKAQLLARAEGPDSPRLAPVYAASGEAYLTAGRFQRAAEVLQGALVLNRLYLPCDSPALGALHQDLAAALAGLRDQAGARKEADLAADAAARCAAAASTRSVADAAASEAADGGFAKVDIYYGTDRAPTGSAAPESFFGAERGDLSFGKAVVTIPRSHKPGAVESPSLFRFEWRANPDRHIVLASVEPLSAEALFAEIRADLAADGSDEILVFVHGYNVTFSDAARRTAQISYDLNFEGVPLLYSWPSRGRPSGYLSDAAVVQLSARRLTHFLDALVARAGAGRVQLIAHSMGNRALTEALELLALGRADPVPIFDQIIFAAPDVDADLFALQVEAIAPLARRLTLYTSDADLALKASRRLHGNAPRAGQGGPGTVVARALDSVDMTVIGDDMLHHSYFANDASALTDILWLFWRNLPPPARCGMVEETGPQGAYWVYVPTDCQGNVLLSAITLARRGGAEALARLDARIATLQSQIGAHRAGRRELDELQQVRAALADLLAN